MKVYLVIGAIVIVAGVAFGLFRHGVVFGEQKVAVESANKSNEVVESNNEIRNSINNFSTTYDRMRKRQY